jgi:PHD/YefM family antitoxin component YafN of YafNO toxin-antitoxin module
MSQNITCHLENSSMSTAQEQYIIDANGNKAAVILTIEQYEKLLEDLHDLAIVAERRQEQSISLEAMRQRLRSSWICIKSPFSHR